MSLRNTRSACFELAMEGERLCKAGDCSSGVQYFEEAVRQGTDDLKTLSIIYSQLGNAYFYLQEYEKAMEYHTHDRTLARSMGDRLEEAKACGNLASTLKMLGRYEEAIACCQHQLQLSKGIHDKVGEGRALYNLGNVYHMKGKQGLNSRALEKDFQQPEGAVQCMRTAIKYYEQNLLIVKSLSDRAAQGRAYGSLGNTNYLLGNYRDAIKYHKERLAIAKEFGDKAAERRAYSNLGNAFVLLGEYATAADFYKRMLVVAHQLKDRPVEAQACYSLGNTYSLVEDYEQAIEFHMRHLEIAIEYNDKVGECKACWSLSNAHLSLGNHSQALDYTKKQLQISTEVGDESGKAAAENKLRELMHVVSNEQGKRVRRSSMEQMELLRITPEQAKQQQNMRGKNKPGKNLFGDKNKANGAVGGVLDANEVNIAIPNSSRKISPDMMEDDTFFDLLTRLQGRRMDDQRCTIDVIQNNSDQENNPPPEFEIERENNAESEADTQQMSQMINMLTTVQSRRMNEQRVSLTGLPGLRLSGGSNPPETVNSEELPVANGNGEDHVLDDQFFSNLIRCQSTRLNDQRSAAPAPVRVRPTPTLPDDDFFDSIMRMQASRFDDQRFEPQDENTDTTNGAKY